MASYFVPRDLAEALALKAASRLTILAGGTDIFPARATRQAWGHRQDVDILDISRLNELRGIDRTDDGWRIGALATWTDIAEATLPQLFNGLRLAAKEVGGRQIQNRGTIAGNICNASPAADGVPPLVAMDAQVEIRGQSESRLIPVLEFIDGYRTTILGSDELVTAILIPKKPATTLSHFVKLGARRYLVISIAMAACVIVPDSDNKVAQACIAVGSCSEKAMRLPALEAAIKGQYIGSDLATFVQEKQFSDLAPIGDIRASSDYRRAAAIDLIRELLRQVGNNMPAGSAS